jgi:CheY-like chemotaxis protein/nitrogen-specific signal transduction histidine kinase
MPARILIIEDNPDNLELMSYLLSAYGHVPLAAKNGEEGLAVSARERPDLILCDIQLPDLDGYAVARRLQGDASMRGIPLVAVTALAMVGDRDKTLAAGFDGYIPKPIDPETFVSLVDAFLRPHRRSIAPTQDLSAPAAPPQRRRGATILVVDDEPSARDLLAAVLGYAGHRVRESADGAEALIEAESAPPDLIICDLMMPSMNGFDLVRHLRAHARLASIPVIFYTASYLEVEARAMANACGVTHILTKPAEPEQIYEVINAVLGIPSAAVPQPLIDELQQTHLSLILAKLSRKSEQALPRLKAMTELSLDLASERDPQRLLAHFCNAARKIFGAEYATVGLLDEHDHLLRFSFSSGVREVPAAGSELLKHPFPIPEASFSMRYAHRLRSLPGDPKAVGLPSTYPQIHCFLSAPIASPSRVYGWLCLADKIGAPEFDDEDAGLAQILAAQVGRIYENGSLYRKIQQHVERLEAEVAERQRAQDEVRTLNAELERRVAERTAELEAANQELDAFSTSVSHDLHSPLRIVGGYATALLEDYAAQVPVEARRLLEQVHNGTRRMAQLIDDLLTFAHLGRQALSKQRFSAEELVREVLEDLGPERAGRSVDVGVGRLPLCRADRGLLKQVWQNLLSNAFKFTSQRDPAIVEISSRDEAGQQVYWVRDNGAGFDMDLAGRLFGVFERLHSSKEFEGTGIGLSIVRRIVQRHGGRVWAESVVGRGATFYFTLPMPPDVPARLKA